MQIYRERELTSTSDEAQRRLAAGEKPLFAIVATRQLKGRGTQGADWVSPEGNLYCSVALPMEAMRPTLAVEVALSIASAVWKMTGLRLTVKWPNDLLFAGKKIGGVLVESTMHGQTCTGLLVGVGLNVQVAPKTTMPTTCLAAEIRDPDLSAVEDVVISAVLTCMTLLPNFSEAFAAFGIDPGQPYSDGQRMAYVRGLTNDAGLELQEKGGGVITIRETRSPWGWVMTKPQPFYVFDVGNTSTKVARWNGVSFDWIRRHNDGDGEADIPQDALCFGISVNAARAKELRQHICWLQKRPVRVRYSQYNLSQLGADRLALAEGARLMFPHDRVLTVSVGTALTMDVIDAAGEHLGGYIVPGPRLQARALAEHTAQLPHVEFTKGATELGLTTQTAIVRGILATLSAGVGFVAEQYACDCVVVTGGDAALLGLGAEVLKSVTHYFDDAVVLRGIVTMATGGA